MVRCLELYYRQARSQKEIAQALGVSAATVSRLLKRAYDDGLVRVELDLPRAEELRRPSPNGSASATPRSWPRAGGVT